MDFRILGPLEVSSEDGMLDLGGSKQRALLALLLLNANRVVPVESLVAALWEDAPPDSARKALQVYVSQVRKTIGKDRIATRPPGYVLHVERDELDLERFERLRAEGELDQALALWRGPVLSDFADDRFAQGERARLEELRLATVEKRIERDLAAGRHRDLIGELDALSAEHPLRERLCAQHMLALYRSGRQADALDVYQRARAALVDELGIEPGAALRDLQQAILNQDPALDLAADASPGAASAPRAMPANGLPTGTVTLVFADIEGSTRLMRDLGARFARVRERSREIVREVVSRRGGHEVDWAGDGVFLAFGGAVDAVVAACEIQRALAEEPWAADEAALRMRIGMHTGEPELGADGYVGIDVHVAARISAAAHGGQVVVSRTTRDVAIGLPEDLTFRPLGRHRLKDLPAQESLFQLVAPGLEDSFPPLKTLGGPTLPALHHRLVGRREDLEQITTLLADPLVRLVTITGPGGAGKSRLALEAAAEASLDRPVHLVGLASISDPDLVPATVARSLGVREAPGHPLAERIADALAGTGTLLLLDNLEHLAPAATHVAELLHRTPGLDILTTSRSPLHLSGEHVVPLATLSIDDAATLFGELAAARGVLLGDDTRPAVREICRRLDCLPLAIELVAARLAILPPSHILSALDEGLTLEMEGPVDLPERQRTLRATIDWSYRLLTDRQRELHGTLAVFAGGCTLEEARALVGPTAGLLSDLEALVAWSLLRSDMTNGDVRLSMLETVRDDALERLERAGRIDELRRCHAQLFISQALEAEPELAGPDQGACFERLERDLDNLRAALDWALDSGDVEGALRATSALGRFWRAHGHVGEARRRLERALARANGVPPEVLANGLWWSARLAAAQDDVRAEEPPLERALELFRELDRPHETAFALGELGWIALQRGEHERAAELCEEALSVARATGDADAISGQLNYLADVYSARGDHLGALAAHEEALALRRTLDDPMLVTNSTYNLGIAAWENGEIARARRAFEETSALATELGDVIHTTAADFMLAELDLLEGELEDAERRILGCLAAYTELQNERSRAECLVVLAGIEAARGAAESAAQLLGAAERLRGDAPPNRFEVPVLERVQPELEERLGADRTAELEAEAALLTVEDLLAVVSRATRH
ncbi:MAG TPA: BTAD domain-containing putative transcriptional regulator [Gaiellaceae bacterium]|nr:BTAD domain-containing putative transcriptional regulator [Gaiellaceae bacterium]